MSSSKQTKFSGTKAAGVSILTLALLHLLLFGASFETL